MDRSVVQLRSDWGKFASWPLRTRPCNCPRPRRVRVQFRALKRRSLCSALHLASNAIRTSCCLPYGPLVQLRRFRSRGTNRRLLGRACCPTTCISARFGVRGCCGACISRPRCCAAQAGAPWRQLTPQHLLPSPRHPRSRAVGRRPRSFLVPVGSASSRIWRVATACSSIGAQHENLTSRRVADAGAVICVCCRLALFPIIHGHLHVQSCSSTRSRRSARTRTPAISVHRPDVACAES